MKSPGRSLVILLASPLVTSLWVHGSAYAALDPALALRGCMSAHQNVVNRLSVGLAGGTTSNAGSQAQAGGLRSTQMNVAGNTNQAKFIFDGVRCALEQLPSCALSEIRLSRNAVERTTWVFDQQWICHAQGEPKGQVK